MQVYDHIDLDTDLLDPDRPPARRAPAAWVEEDDPTDSADEYYSIETTTGMLTCARRGLTTLYLGAETIRADMDTEADAHADLLRIVAEISAEHVWGLRAAAAWCAAAEHELAQARTYRDDCIRAALHGGMGATDIADAAGVTRVRVYQVRDAR